MSIARHLEAAISGAFKRNLDDLARTTWKACAEGLITDKEAEALATAIEARRATGRNQPNHRCKQKLTPSGPPTPLAGEHPLHAGDPGRIRTIPLPRECRSPDRQKSVRRRRQLASSGAVPGTIATHFTTSELAVLTVIARQCQSRKACTWFMDRIAAVAGVSRTTVRNALRQARALGLIDVTERRRTAWRNDSNVIRIISAEWLAWLGLGGGRKNLRTTNNHLISRAEKRGNSVDRSPFVLQGHPVARYTEDHANRQRPRSNDDSNGINRRSG